MFYSFCFVQLLSLPEQTVRGCVYIVFCLGRPMCLVCMSSWFSGNCCGSCVCRISHSPSLPPISLLWTVRNIQHRFTVFYCIFDATSLHFCYLNAVLYESALNGQIKTAQQRTIIQKYSGWYTGRWWVGCYIWYREERPGRAAVPPSSFLDVPNVTAHPSTASVPTLCYSMWHYNCLWTIKG